MYIKFLKGTRQIGGAFTEIQTKGGRILIDFGDDLDDIKRLEQIERTNYWKTYIQWNNLFAPSSRPHWTYRRNSSSHSTVYVRPYKKNI